MMNLILNSNWKQLSTTGGPLNFSGTGPVTFDNFYVNGNRTCSLTMTQGTASDSYTPAIDVNCHKAIRFGYTIRAVEAQSVALNAVFTDSAGTVIETQKVPVQDTVSCDFRRVTTRFVIPTGAKTVKLSLLFEGKVTACTFGAPAAMFVV